MYARLMSALISICLPSLLFVYADAAPVLRGKVVAIANGDTLTLLVDRTQHKVRLYGIDILNGNSPMTRWRVKPWQTVYSRRTSRPSCGRRIGMGDGLTS